MHLKYDRYHASYLPKYFSMVAPPKLHLRVGLTHRKTTGSQKSIYFLNAPGLLVCYLVERGYLFRLQLLVLLRAPCVSRGTIVNR